MTYLKKDMHVLQLPSWYIPEGGQFCRNQAIILDKKIKVGIVAGIHISWKKYKLLALKLPFFTDKSIEDNIFVYRRFIRRVPKLERLNGLLWCYLTIASVKKYIKEHGKPDLIHVHSVLWGGYAAYLIKKRYGIPYVITEHRGVFGLSCEYARNQFHEWLLPFMTKAFSDASTVIPVSSKLIPKIESLCEKPVPIQVISNVVNTDFFHYKERKCDDTEIRFVAVNDFTYVKAYDILIPAFDKALEINPKIRIRIVGAEFDSDSFMKIWKPIKNKNNFQFTGELTQEQVRSELWNANIFIISSRVESQSVSALEALSTGLPLVCTTVIPDQITNNHNSIKVEIENIDALCAAILKMSNTFQDYNNVEISEKIKHIASPEIISEQLIKLYSSIINKS
jgi:glycosyltransferase involved in cell wall biosynthesis